MGIYITFCITAVTAGLCLKQKGSGVASFLQIPGIIGVVGLSYFLGFIHNFGNIGFSKHVPILAYVVLLAAIMASVYLFVKSKQDRFSHYFILALGVNILVSLLICNASLFDFGRDAYFEHFSFGWTEKKYYLPFSISVLAWVGHFALVFWGVIYGALNHHRWMLNGNIILIGIGVFTRFIDLVGNMMDTGMMFIVCGLALFAIGFGLEKWRRKLIAQAAVQ